jgi:hypothetical protein
MRSILNGILISTIIMILSTWFVSSTIVKILQGSKSSSAAVDSDESITEKIKYGKDSISYTKEKPTVYNYARKPRRTYYGSGAVKFQKTSNPFGSKLRIKGNPNPFSPKLSLRRPPWYRNDRRSKPETYQEQNKEQQNNTPSSSKNKSSSPIISGYQNYVDMLNKQMED